jgi:hypothetical protein
VTIKFHTNFVFIVLTCSVFAGCNMGKSSIVDPGGNTLVLHASSEIEFRNSIETMNLTVDRPVDLFIENANPIQGDFVVNIDNHSAHLKTIRAIFSDRTCLLGEIYLGLKGANILIENVRFVRTEKYNRATPVISFLDSRESVVSNCVFSETQNVTRNNEDVPAYFITFYKGYKNQLTNCQFTDKLTPGSIIVQSYMSLKKEGGNHHTIKDCYFGPRKFTGRPTDTAIRMGSAGRWDAETSHLAIGNVIKDNTFDRYNAYYETISIKSSDNQIIGNKFLQCNGYLSLRNAGNCLIQDNEFRGSKKTGTRGVRIQGPGHKIWNNYFENLSGVAMWIWGGTGELHSQPTKDHPVPNYVNTRDLNIRNNTIANCAVPLEFAFIGKVGNSIIPKDIEFSRNLIITDATTTKLFSIREDGLQVDKTKVAESLKLSDNVIAGKARVASDVRTELSVVNRTVNKNTLRKNFKNEFLSVKAKGGRVGYSKTKKEQ